MMHPFQLKLSAPRENTVRFQGFNDDDLDFYMHDVPRPDGGSVHVRVEGTLRGPSWADTHRH